MRPSIPTVMSLVVVCLAAFPAGAESVDDIVAKYVEARGGMARIDAVKSLAATGTADLGGGMEAPFRYEWKGPNRFRFELTIQGMTEVQAFDGEAGWTLAPPGDTEPVPMSPVQFALLNDALDFVGGPLAGYADKGHRVELLGKEEVEGTEAFKLKVTKADGMTEVSYLDAEYFVEILQVEKHDTPGGEVQLETTWADYKEVGGLMLPHSWQRRPRGGPPEIVLTFESIELNADLPDSRFAAAPGD